MQANITGAAGMGRLVMEVIACATVAPLILFTIAPSLLGMDALVRMRNSPGPVLPSQKEHPMSPSWVALFYFAIPAATGEDLEMH